MDVETRQEAADVVKESCALRTVLKPGKPCPYFGPGGNCRDCTYDWITVVEEVGKLVHARRASYERERGKVKALTEELAIVRPVVEKMIECFRILSEVSSSGDVVSLEQECGDEEQKDG